jgi:ppGpp synthetase/RelA/SpoT-type nucleotidyltranferase
MADKCILDPHAEAILEEYRAQRPVFDRMQATIPATIRALLDEAGVIVASIESRIKEEKSLAGKLELKGSKYSSLRDITDIFGMRIITFYTDDVDKVASAVDRLFEVDWDNSVDKRKLLEVDSFGYLSLHYVCRHPDFPYRFEVQMRTILQHAWANMNHDTGYKSGVEIPIEYRRNMNRLAGMLELVDEQFSRIRTELNDYRRQVRSLVASGRLEEVPLDGDSYRSFLELKPFDVLNRRIASVNQAEIQEVSLMPYLAVFRALGFKTLGDLRDLLRDFADAAYQIACYQIGLTDLDILASSVGPQNLCLAFLLKNGSGRVGIRLMLDTLNGPAESNDVMADMIMEQADGFSFMHSKD